jgi:transposase
MKYYTSTTEFNCGIDLHSRQMYVCVMDRSGNKLVHTNIQGNDFAYLLKRVEPYRHSLTVCCECTFNWYWLADACQREGITFVLAHALYLKAIHGGKNKNDRIDSEKLAHLLRSNLIPPSYVYPGTKRPVRALLRQRLFYVWRRAELLARIQSHQLAEGHTPVKQSRPNRDPWEERLLAQYENPLHKSALEIDLAMIRAYDQMLLRLERELLAATRQLASRDYALLNTVPGIGRSLGLTILYEIDTIERFPTVKDFCSYCRLVKGSVASAGKIKGTRGANSQEAEGSWAATRQPVPALGVRRSGGDRQTRSPATAGLRPTVGSRARQVPSECDSGAQTGARRLLHAPTRHRLRCREAAGHFRGRRHERRVTVGPVGG